MRARRVGRIVERACDERVSSASSAPRSTPSGAAPASVEDRELARRRRAEPVERDRADDHRRPAGELARHEHERGRIVERHRPVGERVEPAAARTGRRAGAARAGRSRRPTASRRAPGCRRTRRRPENSSVRSRRRARCARGSGRRGSDAPGSGWRRCPTRVAAVGEEERDRPQRVVGVGAASMRRGIGGAVEEGHQPGPVEAVETVEGGESAGSSSTTPRVTGA